MPGLGSLTTRERFQWARCSGATVQLLGAGKDALFAVVEVSLAAKESLWMAEYKAMVREENKQKRRADVSEACR